MQKIPLSVRTLIPLCALCIGVWLAGIGLHQSSSKAAPVNAVVGDGTPASCDSNALAAAISNGGAITFNCGSNPHTIIADTYVINGVVEIDGGNLLTLDGEGLRQLFLVQEGASLTLRNIILQNGYADNGPGGAVRSFGSVLIQNSSLRQNGTDTVWAGGALANDTNGVMTIENSTLEANSAADGAAIYTRGRSLTILSSAIRDNYTRDNGGFYGGGAILQEINPDGLVTIKESTLEGNQSNPNGSVGGAISLWTGQLLLEGTLVANNIGYGGGGAIYAAQGVTSAIHGSILVDNQTLPADGVNSYLGGAILNHGRLLIDDSTIRQNYATDGGGIYSGGVGSSLTLTRSTVADNVAAGGGGGLLLFPGENVIDNSTISGNSAAIGGGIRSGITVGAGAATLLHVTLFNNSAETNGASLYVDDGSDQFRRIPSAIRAPTEATTKKKKKKKRLLEYSPQLIIDLVKNGELSESRIDQSVKRIMRDKFVLGLFDDPFVNVEQASKIAGQKKFREMGEMAQARSTVLLKNKDLLPLKRGTKVYIEGIGEPQSFAPYAEVVDSPERAEVIIKRIETPFEPRDEYFLEQFFHQGRLYYSEEELNEILGLIKGKPSLVIANLERPALLAEIDAGCTALMAEFGTSDQVLAKVVFGIEKPEGKLPLELPSSWEAVETQLEDLPYDSKDPLYRFGHRLTYPEAVIGMNK